MIPRAPGSRVHVAVLLASFAGLLCGAQQSQPVTPVRYHFGDDPDGKLGWANSNFDDSAWSIAKDGRWPLPPQGTDGFVWTRRRVQVPVNAEGPLALRVIDDHPLLLGGPSVGSFQIFINGQQVTTGGSFPPHQEPVVIEPRSIFELPPGLVQPGANVEIAYRVWFHPRMWLPSSFRGTRFEIGQTRILRLIDHADHLAALIAMGPELAIDAFITILGVVLLAFWRWAGGKELLLCSAFLLAYPVQAFHGNNYSVRFLAIPWRVDMIIGDVMLLGVLLLTLEFTWAIHGYRSRVLKRVGLAAILGLVGVSIYLGLTTAPSVHVVWGAGLGLFSISWDLFLLLTNLWPLFTGRRTWLIGLALAINPAVIMMAILGVKTDRIIGHFYLSFLSAGYLACYLVIFAVVSQSAWKAWRARDELRVEFEAAREMQEQLVAPAVDLPGFQIQSAYIPAKQVGGDFFRVSPGTDGSVLLIVGDVSGKGLKAAMTVSAIMGALRGCNSHQPVSILQYLNSILLGQTAGFVTCSVAHISCDGVTTIANAGNPAPYCNGAEMTVDPGLPLGLLADSTYAETRCQLAPNDRLTFVSDGVLEATSPSGELYGFDRTAVISIESAHQIAKAAELFGQQDDITVLSVTLSVGLKPALA
jgi:sigma-B regulation protein RsbU (phosphoserine phosphatase)